MDNQLMMIFKIVYLTRGKTPTDNSAAVRRTGTHAETLPAKLDATKAAPHFVAPANADPAVLFAAAVVLGTGDPHPATWALLATPSCNSWKR